MGAIHVRMLVDGVFTWGRERTAEVARSPHPEPGVSAKVEAPLKSAQCVLRFWMALLTSPKLCSLGRHHRGAERRPAHSSVS